jgi:hypothetical protein
VGGAAFLGSAHVEDTRAAADARKWPMDDLRLECRSP